MPCVRRTTSNSLAPSWLLSIFNHCYFALEKIPLVLCSVHCQPYVLCLFALRLFSDLEPVFLARGYDGVLLSVCDWTLLGLLPVVCNLDFMLEGQSLKASCIHFLWISLNRTHKSFISTHNTSAQRAIFSGRDNLWPVIHVLFLPPTAVPAPTSPCRGSTGTRRCTRWSRRTRSSARRLVSPTPLKCCKRSWRLMRKVRGTLHSEQMKTNIHTHSILN